MGCTHLGVEDGGVLGGNVSTGDVGAEERQGHERGGADGVALADGGGGVAGRVQGVGALADVLAHARHLGDASGVVADGAVRVNGQACMAARCGAIKSHASLDEELSNIANCAYCDLKYGLSKNIPHASAQAARKQDCLSGL